MSNEGTTPRVSDEEIVAMLAPIARDDPHWKKRPSLAALLDLRDARQRIAALQSENAALKAERDAEQAGIMELRKLGARDDETFPAFVERLQSQVGALREALEKAYPHAVQSLIDRGFLGVGASLTTHPVLDDTAAAGEAYKQRLIQQGRDMERARVDYYQNASIDEKLANARQQGREEGARIALVAAASECDEIAEHNGDAEECSTAIRTLRNPALPLTPEQPTIGDTAVFDPRAVVGDCEPKQPDTEATET